MNSKIIAIVLLISAAYSSAYAQKFGDGNPVWHYEYNPNWGNPVSFVKTTIEKDTIFNGKQCKILSKRSPNYKPFNNMICQDSNKVVFWSPSLAEFQTLYDFDAKKGDKWSLRLDEHFLHGDVTKYIIVDSVYSDTINNKVLQVQNVTSYGDSLYSSYRHEFTVYETIGCIQFLFPWNYAANDFDYVDHIRCFENDSLGFYKFPNTAACEYSEVGINQQSISADYGVSIYPNPSAGNKFWIKGLQTHEHYQILVSDAAGKVVLTQNTGSHSSIDISELSKGFYSVRILEGSRITATKKLLVSE